MDGTPAKILLTGRGAVLGVFVLSFLGLLAAGWLGFGPLAGGTFVLACGLAAARTRRGDLLTVAVMPPALFLVAMIGDKLLTSSGSLLLSATEGTLIALSNTAPWLLAGTALYLVIAFPRGLWDNVRTLRRELNAHPVARLGRPSRPAPDGQPR